jgi:hypothetical protein
MKVLLPPHKILDNSLEQQLQRTLAASKLEGYALMSFSFCNEKGIQHEIDAVLILSPGVFVCLEAKNYGGVWSGSQNEKWICDGQEIKSVGTNPYVQVRRYSLMIQNGLNYLFRRYGLKVFVNPFIIAPDQAQFKIPTAMINGFEFGSRISICNLSQLETTIASIPAAYGVPEIVNEIGVETIVRELADLSPEADLTEFYPQRQEIDADPQTPHQDPVSPVSAFPARPKRPVRAADRAKSKPRVLPRKLRVAGPKPTLKSQAAPPVSSPPVKTQTSTLKENTPRSSPISSQLEPPRASFSPVTVKPPEQPGQIHSRTREKRSPGSPVSQSQRPSSFPTLLRTVLLCSAVTIVGGLLLTTLFRYLAKPPLETEDIVIGAVNSAQEYQGLQQYLDQQIISSNVLKWLGGKDVAITLQASPSHLPNPYPEAIAKIRHYEWDVVFSYSPVIAIEAEDQGYQFIAQMFPGTTGYQSTFFVRENSDITFNQLSTQYTIALGDFFSASKFYMPVYDLYGASLQVMANLNSTDIYRVVQEGKADIGVGVANEQLPEGLKVIKTTRDLPSSGVYLSPQLSPQDARRLTQLILNAPATVKQSANYDRGSPPNYEYFRGIVSRVREVSACSNFAKSPVPFTCGNQVTTTIEGTISNVEISGEFQYLSVEQPSGETCKVAIKTPILKMVLRYHSVFELKGQTFRFYVGFPQGQSCSAQFPKEIYQPNQIEILE